MNRLLKETYDGDAVSYQYDLCGNRKEKVSVAGKETYGYNRRNQLIEKSLQGESCAYEYDMQGNLLEENANGKKRRYGYNPFGQQTEVKEDNFKLENFYDGEFLRAKTSVNGKISRYLYYNGDLQAETYDNDTVKTRYILGYGIAGSETEGRDGSHAYHLDEQNSTAYITGNQRTIENFYEYDAFGGLRQYSEEVKNRILYTGQQYDQETGQYYLRARFYNPVVGRFMQEDVYRGDGLNLYAYCGNNPVVYYDPSGYGKKVVCSKEGEKPEDNGAEGSGDNVQWTNHGHKHTPEKNKSWKDIVKSTKSGPAKYSPDIIDIESFERDAWKTGTPTTNGKNWKTKVYERVIGASEGKETTYIRIENSANTIHGHPISKSEYNKLNKN
ncbi:RHS repeat-associated core domain-containing protein [Lacrimispora sp. JR3]|uniref:RHS repeat-associated core domain-containing protein n=1 Tax=Lacrimispora sinapis TaxID=3111456 RepID=UPI00374980B0